MEKIKLSDTNNTQPVIQHYYNYKDHPMVRISGNFFGGGFNLSKNKLKAIRENLDELQDFIDGKLDKEILELKTDEVLKP